MRRASGRWPTCAAGASRRSPARSPTKSCCSAERELRAGAGLLRRRHASLHRSRARSRRCGAARQRPRRTLDEGIAGFTIQPASVATGHYVGLLAPRETPRCATDQPVAARGHARRFARAHLSKLERLERRSAGAVSRAAGRRDGRRRPSASTRRQRVAMSRLGSGAALPALAASGVAGHPGVVVSVRWGSRSRSAC